MRQRFPGVRDDWARLDGPAGTQMVDAAIDAMASWAASGSNANTGGPFAAADECDALLDRARRRVADLLGGEPDIEIVGDDLHPMLAVKDFAPYIAKIKASNADAVITANWSADLTLLVKAAKESGLKLPFYTVNGATTGVPAALAAASPDSPGELARKVASPGGMTQKGLDVLDADQALVRLLTETLRAARDRGREMAQAARGEG